MHPRSKPWLVLVALALLVALGGCQSLEDKRKIDYGKTRTLPPLAVPPDLSAPPAIEPAADNSTAEPKPIPPPAAAGSAVLPQYSGIKLARDGRTRWLVVNAEPASLWDPVREFVLANGLLIAAENPQTGVIETDWAENRANIGNATQKLLAKVLGSLYSTGMRDKYRLRLERGSVPGTTEIYLTHQGMEEVLPEGSSASPIWRPRASDPELEVEMLQRLRAHLGSRIVASQTPPPPAAAATAPASPAPGETTTGAPAAPAATTPAAPANAALARNGNGTSVLSLQDSLDRAWRRVGLSLDRIGFTVEDRDRSKGIYYVRYIDPDQPGRKKGFLSRWFGGSNKEPADQYQVQLTPAPSGTHVEVLSKEGAPETSKTGERILSLLYEQLK